MPSQANPTEKKTAGGNPRSGQSSKESPTAREQELMRQNEELRKQLLKATAPEAEACYNQEAALEQKRESVQQILSGARVVEPTSVRKSLIAFMTPEDRAVEWYKSVAKLDDLKPLDKLYQAGWLAKSYGLSKALKVNSKTTVGRVVSDLISKVIVVEPLVAADGNNTPAGDAVNRFLLETVPGWIEPSVQSPNPAAKPIWMHPGAGRTASEAFAELTEMLKNCGQPLYRMGGVPCLLQEERVKEIEDSFNGSAPETKAPFVHLLKPVDLVSVIDTYTQPTAFNAQAQANVLMSLSEAKARQMFGVKTIEHLPRLNILVNHAPLRLRPTGEPVVLPKGYDPETGIYVYGDYEYRPMELAEAIQWVESLMLDARPQTEADRSRYLAGFLTPALRLGGFIKRGAPLDVCEAIQPQSGKGYRVAMIATLYDEKITPVQKRRDGVGKGLDEAFDVAISKGRPLVVLDNLKGSIDSSTVESFLTLNGGPYPCRIPYGSITVDSGNYVLYATSNEAEFTNDITERSVFTRIYKLNLADRWIEPRTGLTLIEHVAEHRSDYLDAIYTLISDWWRLRQEGSGLTSETRHTFSEWAQAMDFIVQNYFGLPPILDGHELIKKRVKDAYLVFVRDVCRYAHEFGRLGQPMSVSMIVQMCEQKMGHIPGLNDRRPDAAKRQVGLILGFVLGDADAGDDYADRRFARFEYNDEADEDADLPPATTITLEGFKITRKLARDSRSRMVKQYVIEPSDSNIRAFQAA